MFNNTFYQKNGSTFHPPTRPEINETQLFKDYLNQTDAFKDDMKKDLGSRKTLFGKLMQPSEAGSMEIWLETQFVKSVVEGDRLFISATQMDPTQGELVDIDTMEPADDGVMVKATLMQPLSHYHYGSTNNALEIDERALVIRFGTNNNPISIQGAPKVVLKGETHLVNIQFTETGPLQIQKVQRDRKLIQGCSFNTMEGNVIESDDSNHVHVIEN